MNCITNLVKVNRENSEWLIDQQRSTALRLKSISIAEPIEEVVVDSLPKPEIKKQPEVTEEPELTEEEIKAEEERLARIKAERKKKLEEERKALEEQMANIERAKKLHDQIIYHPEITEPETKPVDSTMIETEEVKPESEQPAAPVTEVEATETVEEAETVKEEPVATIEIFDILGHEQSPSKPILIFGTADWCTNCLWMENVTFKNKEVAGMLDSDFEFHTMNMDTLNGKYLADLYSVDQLPAYLFFDRQGNLIQIVSGPKYAKAFSSLCRSMLEPEQEQPSIEKDTAIEVESHTLPEARDTLTELYAPDESEDPIEEESIEDIIEPEHEDIIPVVKVKDTITELIITPEEMNKALEEHIEKNPDPPQRATTDRDFPDSIESDSIETIEEIVIEPEVEIPPAVFVPFDYDRHNDQIFRQERQAVLVVLETEWCTTCTWMANVVYKDQKVWEFFASNCISVRMDASENMGKEIAEKVGATTYPAWVVFENGEYRLVHEGSMNKVNLLKAGENWFSN